MSFGGNSMEIVDSGFASGLIYHLLVKMTPHGLNDFDIEKFGNVNRLRDTPGDIHARICACDDLDTD